MRMDTGAQATIVPYLAILGRIAEMRARCDKATAGPWHADTKENYTCGGDMVEITLHDKRGMVVNQIASILLDTDDESAHGWREQEANANHIAHARVDLPLALDLLELAVKALNHIRSIDLKTCVSVIAADETLWKLCNAMTKGTE